MAKSWFSTDRTGVVSTCMVFQNKRLYSLTAIVLLILSLSITAFASESYTPWPGEFMRMGAGARAMGMGNAYTAIEGDVYSTYFNPAGLAAMEERQLALSIRYLPFDRRFLNLAYGVRIGPDADFGFSWIQAGTDDITGRDLNGNPTGNVKDSRNALAVTFSRNINKMLAIGINTKLSIWKLGSDDARTFGFDIGIIFRPINHLTLSMVTRDLNSRYAWSSDRWKNTVSGPDGQSREKEDKFPAYHTLGAAYRLLNNRLVISTTAELIEDNPTCVNAGVSYDVTDRFSLRTGMYHYTADDELDSGSFTAGLTLGLTGRTVFDYAYIPDDFTGESIHIISFIMSYGE